jgi:hypothetical protein
MTAGRIPMFGIDGSVPPAPVEEAWECADCGWGIDAAHLVPGWTIEQARETHADRYCACPPSWP